MRKPTDDAEGPTYLSPAWHRARRLAREVTEAKATPAQQPQSIPEPYHVPPPQPKPKKVGTSPLAKRRIELSTRWRRCDVPGCGLNTDGMSSLCRHHLHNRRTFGHAKVSRRLKPGEYLHLIKATLRYFRSNPPPQSILESVQSFLTPPGKLTGPREVGRKARLMLIAEMVRWQSPRYRRTRSHRPGYNGGKAGYGPRDYLAVLVAVEAYIAEREGRGFPGDVEDYEKAFALVKLHRRPSRRGVSAARAAAAPPGIIKGTTYTQQVTGTVLRAIAARLREFNTLGVYIHQTAKAVLALPRPKPKPPRKRMVTATKPATSPHPLGDASPPTPGAPPPTPTRQVKVTLLPQYAKPTTRPGCTIADLRAWEENRRQWRQYPQGFYFQNVNP